jgi:cation:H+ antiporter
MISSVLILILGLATLVIGGEFFVKGAVGIALKFKVSTLVIGLTVVSFGTSAPELLVSLSAAIDGRSAIAIGNVVGSNIANLALVLGVTCIIFPISVRRSTLRVDWNFMMLSSLILFAFMFDGIIHWWEGAIMFTILLVYIVWSIRRSRRNDADEIEDDVDLDKPFIYYILFTVLGCIALAFGSDWMLDGAVDIAKYFDVSDSVIGATIIAFGTSVPELATSSIAAFRKETDISIGNLIGSNIFNILCILGLIPMVKEVEFNTSVLSNEMVWMLVISFLILPLSIKTLSINRWKGVFLALLYVFFSYFMVF